MASSTGHIKGHIPLAQIHFQKVVNSPEDSKATQQHEGLKNPKQHC